MPAISTKKIQEARRRTGADSRVMRRMGEGLIVSYIHHNGKLGVLVEVNCETDFVARTEAFTVLARQLAEHIAAAAPMVVEREHLPADVIDRKRSAFEEEVRWARKPERLVTTIVDGKMAAYFRSVVLMEQAWVREPKITIGDLVQETSAKTGEAVRVRRFARFHMGIA